MTIEINPKEVLKIIGGVQLGNKIGACVNFIIKTDEVFVHVDSNDNGGILGKLTVDAFSTSQENIFSVPYQIFYDIINTIKSNKCSLLFSETSVEIVNNKSKYKVSMVKDNTPASLSVIENEEFTHSFSFDKNDFNFYVKNTSPFCSFESFKPTLKGVNFDFSKDKLSFVATDGKVMSIINKFDDTKSNTVEASITVPSEPLKKVISDLQGDTVKVDWNTSAIMFTYDNIRYLAYLIEGKYPNYNQIIPKDNDKVVSFNKKEILAAVNEVGVILNNSTSKKLMLNFNNGVCKICTSYDNNVFSENEINYVGNIEQIGIAFNYKYLTNIFSHINSDEITIEFFDTSRPAKIYDNYKQSEYYFIAMPMNMDE